MLVYKSVMHFSVNPFSSWQDGSIRNGLTNNIIIMFAVLEIFLLTLPSRAPAYQVNKSSVLLKEVREMKTGEDVVYAEESVYVGGISGNRPSHNFNRQEVAITLREIRPTNDGLPLSSGLKIEVTVIPTVARKIPGKVWSPALGTWDFKYGETNNYKSAIHVQMGGDLDIAFQSSGMKIGEKDNVLHYGLNGNPHAIVLSRKRLKAAFPTKESSSKIKPILNYQPSSDMILVQIKLTAEGLSLEPIFDYEVVKN